MIANMNNNKKLNPVVTESFIRERNLSISMIVKLKETIVFITQS